MALIRWEPVAELNTIQNEMNRLFNTFFDPAAPAGRDNGTQRRWLPAMDLVESHDQYVLRADLPGLSDGDVNIQLEDNVLTISGERKTKHEKEEGFYRLERAYGGFSRSLTLPDGVDPEASKPTSTAACSKSASPSQSRRSPRLSRSPSAPTPSRPPTPRRIAATQSPQPEHQKPARST